MRVSTRVHSHSLHCGERVRVITRVHRHHAAVSVRSCRGSVVGASAMQLFSCRGCSIFRISDFFLLLIGRYFIFQNIVQNAE